MFSVGAKKQENCLGPGDDGLKDTFAFTIVIKFQSQNKVFKIFIAWYMTLTYIMINMACRSLEVKNVICSFCIESKFTTFVTYDLVVVNVLIYHSRCSESRTMILTN